MVQQNLLCFAERRQAERLAPLFATTADDHAQDVVHPAVLCYVREELAAKTQEAERLQQEREALQAQLDAIRHRLRRLRNSPPYGLRSGLRRAAHQK